MTRSSIIPPPWLMIWTQDLGACHCRSATSAPTSRTAAIARSMIQRRGDIGPRGSGSGRVVARERVEFGGRSEVLPVSGAELLERVRVLLRPAMLDGIDGRQGGHSADHRPGPSALQPHDEAGTEGVAGPRRVD